MTLLKPGVSFGELNFWSKTPSPPTLLIAITVYYLLIDVYACDGHRFDLAF
jgi:hypothetical protein